MAAGITNAGGGKRIKDFFGDGSLGAFNLDIMDSTTLPSGGNLTDLFKMSAGNDFQTNEISSTDDGVLFEIDMGENVKWDLFKSLMIYNARINSGGARDLYVFASNNRVEWIQIGSTGIYTQKYDKVITLNGRTPYRYIRAVLRAGGGNTVFTCSSAMLNGAAHPVSGTVPPAKEYSAYARIPIPEIQDTGLSVMQFESFHLKTGHTLFPYHPALGVAIYSQTGITIDGEIDMSKCAPEGPATKPLLSVSLKNHPLMHNAFLDGFVMRGGAGGNGGAGGRGDNSIHGPNAGIGGSGGTVLSGARNWCGGFGGGGGGGGGPASNAHGGNGGQIVAPVGGGRDVAQPTSDYLITSRGRAGHRGSGGGGGHFGAQAKHWGVGGGGFGGGGGGNGAMGGDTVTQTGKDGERAGGFICLISKGDIKLNGALKANGGNGGDGSNGSSKDTYTGSGGGGGGGGAGGGCVLILHRGQFANSGEIQVNGGNGGAGGKHYGPRSFDGNPGVSGSIGSIEIKKI